MGVDNIFRFSTLVSNMSPWIMAQRSNNLRVRPGQQKLLYAIYCTLLTTLLLLFLSLSVYLCKYLAGPCISATFLQSVYCCIFLTVYTHILCKFPTVCVLIYYSYSLCFDILLLQSAHCCICFTAPTLPFLEAHS